MQTFGIFSEKDDHDTCDFFFFFLGGGGVGGGKLLLHEAVE